MMFEWLADPAWGGIGTIVSIVAGIIGLGSWALSKRKKMDAAHHKTLPGQKALEQNEVHGMVRRFVELYTAHGIERTQIPRFLGEEFGLTLADVLTDEKLLHVLNEKIITKTCELFCVRREWLDGADSQVHPVHDFYKQPREFSGFIENLLAANPEGRIIGVLVAPKERDWQAYALLIFQETVGFIGDKPIYRFHLCSNWAFTYWKARAYLTACVAAAWKRKVYVWGIYLPKNEINRLADGNVLLGWQGEGVWKLGHKAWYPEDMALNPEEFLRGVAPEQDNYGIKAGLSLWLDLEEKGFMDTGIAASVRQQFQQELAKY